MGELKVMPRLPFNPEPLLAFLMPKESAGSLARIWTNGFLRIHHVQDPKLTESNRALACSFAFS